MKIEKYQYMISCEQRIVNLLAKANDFKEGDLLVGGTRDETERARARSELAGWRLRDFDSVDIIHDQLTECLRRKLDTRLNRGLGVLSLEDLKQILLSSDCNKWVERYRKGLRSETIAAVVKLMTNEELSF